MKEHCQNTARDSDGLKFNKLTAENNLDLTSTLRKAYREDICSYQFAPRSGFGTNDYDKSPSSESARIASCGIAKPQESLTHTTAAWELLGAEFHTAVRVKQQETKAGTWNCRMSCGIATGQSTGLLDKTRPDQTRPDKPAAAAFAAQKMSPPPAPRKPLAKALQQVATLKP
ncbi:hypothetical protein B7463_g9563, partial [Scytalidium lignicola]